MASVFGLAKHSVQRNDYPDFFFFFKENVYQSMYIFNIISEYFINLFTCEFIKPYVKF